MITVRKAVLLGHAFVNLPVLLIIGSGIVVGHLMQPSYGMAAPLVGLAVGIAAGWLWWSVTVPRWRKWAKRSGVDEEEMQLLAERTGLVWPKGSFFEKTEFRIEDDRRSR